LSIGYLLSETHSWVGYWSSHSANNNHDAGIRAFKTNHAVALIQSRSERGHQYRQDPDEKGDDTAAWLSLETLTLLPLYLSYWQQTVEVQHAIAAGALLQRIISA
jgi:hypothetical protein